MRVVAAGRWDLALSAQDPSARAVQADLAARAGLGVQADLVAQANRAVQADPGDRAAHLGRGRQALAGLVVQDAPVRVVSGLTANRGMQARSAP